MEKASYPRPVCSKCGMPMTLDTATGRWHCSVCKEDSWPLMPPQIVERPNLARPQGWLVRVAIVVAIVTALAFVRVFLM